MPQGSEALQLLYGRLYNWKFSSAQNYLADTKGEVSKDDEIIIRALANEYGNVGWFDGAHVAVIIDQLEQLTGYTKWYNEVIAPKERTS